MRFLMLIPLAFTLVTCKTSRSSEVKNEQSISSLLDVTGVWIGYDKKVNGNFIYLSENNRLSSNMMFDISGPKGPVAPSKLKKLEHPEIYVDHLTGVKKKSSITYRGESTLTYEKIIGSCSVPVNITIHIDFIPKPIPKYLGQVTMEIPETLFPSKCGYIWGNGAYNYASFVRSSEKIVDGVVPQLFNDSKCSKKGGLVTSQSIGNLLYCFVQDQEGNSFISIKGSPGRGKFENFQSLSVDLKDQVCSSGRRPSDFSKTFCGLEVK